MLSPAQRKAIEAIIAAGGLEKEVPWRGLVNTGTVKSLIDCGIFIGKIDYGWYIPRISPCVQVNKTRLAEVDDFERTRDKKRGTCQVCFRNPVLLTDGTTTQHGWEEEGGRRRGEYGNAIHVGSCLGAGFLPLEQDQSRAFWYLHQHLPAERAECQGQINMAKDPKRRPAVLRVHRRRAWVELKDDGKKLSEAVDASPYIFELNRYIKQRERIIRDIDAEIKRVQRYLKDYGINIDPKKKK